MNRIDKKFQSLKEQKKKALIIFITAGDPNLKKTEELIYAFEEEGVDMIELGVPFSDPLADGPVIQAASQRALSKKINLKKILALVNKVRKKSKIPILLMSYLNPILHYGVKDFSLQARASGVDGVIVPDLPPDEGEEISKLLAFNGISLVYFLAPTSTAARRKYVVKKAKGFIYYVSLTGVTGTRQSVSTDFKKNIQAAKKLTTLPICIGFGVSTPKQAQTLSSVADGVIVGSAIVKALNAQPRVSAIEFTKKVVRPFVRALKRKAR